MARVPWLGAWLGLGCAVWLAAAAPAPAQEAALGALAGTWVRDQRERDDAARDAAIVRATEPLSVAFRGIARGVMRRRMVPAERYMIEKGAAPSIRNETTGVAVPVNGRPHVIGKDHEVTSRIVAAGVIEQVWKQGASHGTTRWQLSSDGDHLLIMQHLHDPHFEAPIQYSTTYRRAP
jgi:hypothetical protein